MGHRSDRSMGHGWVTPLYPLLALSAAKSVKGKQIYVNGTAIQVYKILFTCIVSTSFMQLVTNARISMERSQKVTVMGISAD